MVWFMLWGEAMPIIGFLAATGVSIVCFKRSGSSSVRVPTIAFTEPEYFASDVFAGWPDGNHFVKALVRNINSFGAATGFSVSFSEIGGKGSAQITAVATA
jgi:hypothetical protein